MTEITQVSMRAFSDHRNATNANRTQDMKTFIAGSAIKFTMIISSPSTVAKIRISDPQTTALIDDEDMTQEADYVYSYVYQSPSDDLYTGAWIVTYKVTDGGITMLTQDKFILITQNPL